MAEEPWFTLYKRPGHRKLVPRNAKAVLLTIAAILVLWAPGIVLLITRQLWILWVMIPWMAITLFVFIRFARRRSEVVPIDEAVALWRREQGKKRR